VSINFQPNQNISHVLFDSLLSYENPLLKTNISLNIDRKKSNFKCNSKIASFINKYSTDICSTTSASHVSSLISQNENQTTSLKSSKQLILSIAEKFGFNDECIDKAQIEQIENLTAKIETDGVGFMFNQDSNDEIIFEDELDEVELTFKSMNGYKIRSRKEIVALYFGKETKIESLISYEHKLSIDH
jgi:hypothetical protein